MCWSVTPRASRKATCANGPALFTSLATLATFSAEVMISSCSAGLSALVERTERDFLRDLVYQLVERAFRHAFQGNLGPFVETRGVRGLVSR
ncbi:unnamed protein product [Gemmata massiliana]|uniref:Uncharacterized protein n=1 Tax=Gemmata massiliana TaxID=1210884 RepID=A0A6P2CZ79_9BACT|nr:unnamed protein product [Gemmata massiliana]